MQRRIARHSITSLLLLLPGGLMLAQVSYSNAIQTVIPTSALHYPYGVAVDTSGNVYIADGGNNRVLKETLAGGTYSESVMATSPLAGPFGIAVDSNGSVYIADSGHNRVLKEAPSGNTYVESTVGSGLSDPVFVAVDASGNVYISDNGNRRVVMEIVSGGTYTQSVVATGFRAPTGVAVDSSGNVYVVDFTVAQVFKESPSGGAFVSSLLPLSGLANPEGIAVDASGNLFIADSQNNRIVEETPQTDGSYTQAAVGSSLYSPIGVAVDASENLYVTDTGNARVVEISPSSGDFGKVNVNSSSSTHSLTFTFASSGTLGSTAVYTQGATGGAFQDVGTGTCVAGMPYSTGQSCTIDVKLSPMISGAIYGSAVLKAASGQVILSISLQGIGVEPQISFLPGTQSTAVSHSAPGTSLSAIAVDGKGTIYVADSNNGTVWKETPSGGGYVESGPIASGFQGVSGLTVDTLGNLYVVDSWGNAIYMESPTPTGYYQSALAVGISTPTSVAVDLQGNLYITDSQQGSITKETISGGIPVFTTLPFSSISRPDGVAVDASGDIYISDTYNGRVVKETPSGTSYVESVVASGLGQPQQLALDGNGNVYIADSENSVVLKETWTGSGYVQSTLADAADNGLIQPYSVALDSAQNVYIASSGGSTVLKEQFDIPPALTFTSTTDGTNTVSSTQKFSVSNVGNAPLLFPVLATTDNPALTGPFTLDSNVASPCPVTPPGSSQPGTLAAGASCNILLDFVPPGLGSYSGSLTFTDNTVNAPAPSYAGQTALLSGTQVSPTFTIGSSISSAGMFQGSSITSTITVNPQSGFTVNANLSVSGLPSGVTASFSSNPTSNTSILTIKASQTATTGNATLTITGTSGTQTATTSIYITVVASNPGIYLSPSPAYITLAAGDSGSSTITITDLGGFTGAVNLAVSGAPAGVTASMSPGSATTSSQLLITTSGTTLPGTYDLNVTGTSGSVSGNTVVGLTVMGTPQISWHTPSPIFYGTALSATQLNATADVPGTFSYSPAAGTVLNAGTQTLTVTFTPTDTKDYMTTTKSISLLVEKANPSITWPTPAAITYGTPLSSKQLNASANVPGTFVYTPASGAVLNAGTQTLSATFTPTDTTNYATATDIVSLTVNKVTPTVTWPTPAAIAYGTPLSSAQLDATANVAGTFSYSPAAGTVLSIGTHTLTATFTPTDTADFTTATANVPITVNSAFTLSASPASLTLAARSSTSSTITINHDSTFTGQVTLSVSGVPSGVSASFSVNPATSASVLTLSAGRKVSSGTYTLVVTGTYGSYSTSTPITLTIGGSTSGGGGGGKGGKTKVR